LAHLNRLISYSGKEEIFDKKKRDFDKKLTWKVHYMQEEPKLVKEGLQLL
jgi:hypothetical protein